MTVMCEKGEMKVMAEYLSPGVYVEEFDSGSKPMEGVGTSTAGFIGLAERGPVEGLPQLVTNFSDFKRKYGGYLSENEFGEYRFLAYAVEHFFINGGARCFIARVAPEDAKCAAAAVPSEAFFVNIGRDTMSQDDIDNGRLVCVIGVAPVKPAEFVIFRISQKTSDSGSAE